MPQEPNREGSYGFQAFLLFLGIIVVAFLGWLVWATIEFSPTAEKDIGKSLVSSPLFQRGVAITNQSSLCRSSTEVKSRIPAVLFVAFREANQLDSNPDLGFHRFQKEKLVLGGSKSPDQWQKEMGSPVLAVSNAGIHENQALVCLELFGSGGFGRFVVLEHAGADYWRIIKSESAWQDDRELPPEEVPELTLPSF